MYPFRIDAGFLMDGEELERPGKIKHNFDIIVTFRRFSQRRKFSLNSL